MSSKINIFGVINGHMSTLIDAKTSKKSLPDITTFYLLPLALAAFGIYFEIDFSKEATNLLVTAGALFTGLLLNLLILVYDQKSKLDPVNSDLPNWSEVQLRHRVLKELYYNISYSTFISVMIVVIAIVHLFIINKVIKIPAPISISIDLSSITTSPFLMFIGINLVLTILMIIKRIYTLLSSET
jgi:hypothetical protein